MWPRNIRTHNHTEALGKHMLEICAHTRMHTNRLSMQLFPSGIPWVATRWLSWFSQRGKPFGERTEPCRFKFSRSLNTQLNLRPWHPRYYHTDWGLRICTSPPCNRKQLSQLHFSPRQTETNTHTFGMNFSFVPFFLNLEKEETFLL